MESTILNTSRGGQTESGHKTVIAAREAIDGKRKGLKALIPFLGPAFIASIAYVDPGNYATNIQGGAQFGFKLLWVIVIANLIGMLVQNLSAKLGIATGKDLPEMCREHFPKVLTYALWVFSEIAAMATDLAEFLGATLALNLLFGIPMLPAALLTGFITFLILAMERFGFRPMERFIAAFLFAIGICYVIEMFISKPDVSKFAYHSVVPWIGNSESVLLAVGIIGATVMPHAVYLHSNLTKNRIVPRNEQEALKISRYSTKEVIIAMTLAGLINMAMMTMAATAFYQTGNFQVGNIETAYLTLTPLLGSAAAGVFLVSLLASGISSSVVGTMAGQVIMQGFVGFTIPLWLRRAITMLPAIIIVALGVDPTRTLVISQVVLSLVLPMPILALIHFTRRKDIMGVLANKPLVSNTAILCAAIVLFLNIILIYQTFGGSLPFLG
ncbi:Nramp family divalent metal transporter [Paenibacillus humicus]|uniref:Nramp family divalent metal transporter n=1 Tax=Paenibacillus humicus TaxID=412861 RepID=UPI003F188F40